MSRSIGDRIRINHYADLFGGGENGVITIPVTDLYQFRDHPFLIRDDEDMERLCESIQKNGILNPVIVRVRPEAGYEIISGHRRTKDLLQSMSAKDIINIRDMYLLGDEKEEDDPLALIEIIVNKPWKNNAISCHLANLWGLSDSIFEKEKDDTFIKNEIKAPDDQFFELLDYQYYIKQRVLMQSAGLAGH